MKKFTSPGLCRCIGKSGFLTLGLMVLLAIAGTTAKAQDTFATAQVLTGDSGQVTVDNTGVTPDVGAPTIAGLTPQATIWFQWSTTNSGEVELDTIGSVDDFLGVEQLDTVLGVFTGTNLTTLNVVSENDDLYPNFQANEVGQNSYSFGDNNYSQSMVPPPTPAVSLFGIIEQPFSHLGGSPFAGPSGLRFNAVAGVTYYFAVDTRNFPGNVSLNWSLVPSGVFRFATENADLTGLTYPDGFTRVLLYQTAESESSGFSTTGGDPIRYSLFNSVGGVLVTVTRVAGSSGRVTVDYTTEDLTTDPNFGPTIVNGFLPNGDLAALAGTDYTAKSGTLTFDDNEMSKTFLVPIISSTTAATAEPNRDFGVVLSNPQLDPSESTAVSLPRVDPVFSTALVRILDDNIDPAFGPTAGQLVTTNGFDVMNNPILVTNLTWTTEATNALFNFELKNYRVYRAGTNQVFTIYVDRFGTNTAGVTIHYAVNTEFPFLKDNLLNDDYFFPLTPGSDYATPDPKNSGAVGGVVPDYIFPGGYSGTIAFGANDSKPKPITFTVYNNGKQQFDEDFDIELYQLDKNGNPYPVGMVNNTTVTILNASDLDGNSGNNNINPPAGAVDEIYNADYGSDFFINTVPPQMAHPGTDGEVYGLAMQPDGKTIVVGNFFSYDQSPVNYIARATSSGYLDTSFNSGSGADDFIDCVVLNTNNEAVIGGNFLSYNGTSRSGIAMLNTSGGLDMSFNPGEGFNDTVLCLALQTNGQIIVGGNFTQYNGLPAYYLARLNPDGTLDQTFNPGTELNAAVHAIAVQPNGQILVGGDFTSVNGVTGHNYLARLNGDGSVDTTFDLGSGPNGPVYAVGVQPDGNVVIGGSFNQVNGQNLNEIARLVGTNGSIDANFFGGIGLDGPVFNLNVQTNAIFATTNSTVVAQSNFTIYVGGQFTEYNATHRLGFLRLNADGTIDTSFMDTAYNQFAGLTREYYNDPIGSVLTSVLKPDGDIQIGGSFEQVGGGEYDAAERPADYTGAFSSTITRSGVRNHSNIAQLHGGATLGPGNVALNYTSYSVNKSASSLFVALVRTNGFLGPAAADFQVIPGLASNGVDYLYDGAFDGTSPLYWILWEYDGPSRMHSDGFFQFNDLPSDAVFQDIWSGVAYADVNLTVTGNTNSFNDLSASFLLSNPVHDNFYLGGEDIPLGVGLGESSAPLTLIEDRHPSGTFGFAATSYTGTGLTAPIAVTRTNGTFGFVTVDYATSTNGSTAIANVDYRPISGGQLTFSGTQSNLNFNVTILASNSVSSIEKIVNLQITGINPPVNGIANLGLTNAVLRIINPNFQGFLNLNTNAYAANLSAGSVTVAVTRTVGDKGTLNVMFETTNGINAFAGTDFTGVTNLLTWNSGDPTPRMITIPLLNNGQVGTSKAFGVRIYNPTNNAVSAPSLFAVNGTTNATITINNDNSYGTFQLSSPTYVVNENGGYSTITVFRSGSTNNTASVQLATADGTAFAMTNYTGTNLTLNFAAGQLATNVYVQVVDDGIVDPYPFYFTVSISSPSAGAFLGTVTTATNYIVDAESFNRPPGNGDTSFNPGTGMNGDVLALALQSTGKILAGGSFTTVNGVPENYVARLNTDGTLDNTGFLNGLAAGNGSVYAVVDQTDDQIVVGGAFTSFNGVVRNRITRLNSDGSIDSSFNPGAGADNTIYCLAESFVNGGRVIYAGGTFSTMGGKNHPNLVRLTQSGTVDSGFAPVSAPNGPVYAVAAYPTNSYFAGKIVVGGSFTNIDGFAVMNVARMNADGSTDTNFDLNLTASGTVRAIAIESDDSVVIGGDFTNVDGVACNHIAHLLSNGTLDNSFSGSVSTATNGTVNAIAIQQDGRMVVGGQFAQASGVTRNGITRLLANGAVDPTIDFGDGANGSVDAVVVQPADQMLVIGGGFTTYNDQPAGHIERVYGGSETGIGAFEFTSANFSVNENGVQALIGIRRTGGTSGPGLNGTGNVSVNFATSDNTATNGINYTAVNQNVSFPPGEVLQYVPVPVMDDSNITPNLTVNLTLSNPTPPPATLGDQPTATLTIINDDNAVQFTSGNFSVGKNTGTGFGAVDVQRTGTTNGTCTVDYYTITNGTATIGTDYYPTNGTLTFSPGQTEQIIYVPVINNGLVEGNKTVDLILTNNQETLLFAPSNSVLTIDDTTAAPGELYFSATNYVAGSGDGSVTLTVLRTNGTSGSVSVTYTTVQGTAVPGIDYSQVTNTVSFGDGVTSETFSIPLLNNPVPQEPVTINVFLSNPTGLATLTTPTNTTVTIINTNAGVEFVAATNTVIESAGSASLFVSRIGNTNGTLTVNYSTTNGTAMAGTNFTAVSGPLSFAIGETLKAISVPLIYDPKVTGTLQFTVGLNSTNPNITVVNPKFTTVNELDADAGLSFTNPTTSVAKNGGVAAIPVITSNTNVEPYSVSYSTANGTAVAGTHYTPVSGTLTFSNGIAKNYFYVPILNNGVIDTNRYFTVQLSGATAPGQVIAPSNQTVTIVESQSGFSFTKPTYLVLRNGGIAATIGVNRAGNTNNIASVNFTATNGTAVPNLDYTATNGVLVFTNGVTNETFQVPVYGRTTVQPDDTVLLQLLSPTNAILSPPSAATLTIHDTSGSLVVPAGSALTYESYSPPNGIIDPGETVTLMFGLRASGGTNIPDVTAQLLVTNGITSPSGMQNYGGLVVNGPSVSKPFTFTAVGTNSQQIAATFLLGNGVTSIGTAVFTYTLGTWTNVFYNSNSIYIPDDTTANPYPSTISVSGVGGSLMKATATVTNLTHVTPIDIDILLASPGGPDTLLMSHAGAEFSIKSVTLNFDDAATTSLPQNAKIVSGTNKPTAYGTLPSFP